MRLLTTTLLFPDNPIFQVYLFAEHRRHQILPGLVRDGDIGFQGIVVFVTGEGHHDLGRHSLFKGVDDEDQLHTEQADQGGTQHAQGGVQERPPGRNAQDGQPEDCQAREQAAHR